jgi:hypothetical protein
MKYLLRTLYLTFIHTLLMTQTPLSPELRTAAAAFSHSYAQILASLCATLSRLFHKMPHLPTTVTVPLYGRLNRTVARVQRLMALLAAGRLPRAPRPGRTARPAAARKPSPRIPTQYGWLVDTCGYEAAAFRSQLRHLLAQPGMAELLATTPSVGRILRTPCRLLGIALPGSPAPTASPRRARPTWLAPPPVPVPPIRWGREPEPRRFWTWPGSQNRVL